MIISRFIYKNKQIKYKFYYTEKALIYNSYDYSYEGIIKYKVKGKIFYRSIPFSTEQDKDYDIYKDKNLKKKIENRIIRNLEFNEKLKKYHIISATLKHKGMDTAIRIYRGEDNNEKI